MLKNISSTVMISSYFEPWNMVPRYNIAVQYLINMIANGYYLIDSYNIIYNQVHCKPIMT